MKKIKINGFIHARKCPYTDSIDYAFFAFKADDYVTVCDHQIEVSVPDDFNIEVGMIANLEASKEAATVQFHKRIAEINNEISKLQCLEMTP